MDSISEKMRQQKIIEDADYQIAMETFSGAAEDKKGDLLLPSLKSGRAPNLLRIGNYS